MESAYSLLGVGAPDPATTIAVALIGAAGMLMARWLPKTRTEAQVDTSAARLADAQAWGELVDSLRARVEQMGKDLEKDRARYEAELAAEREECDRRINALEGQVADFKQQVSELRARIDAA